MEPVFAAVFAWTLGNEPFTLAQASGGLLIVLTMVLSELPIEKFRLNGKVSGQY
jgi:drug/metabolite transporter (DMT)-like permease